ncbi:hypothetical protein PAEPH01_0623 [Pancytospora epiphaga]|nr:hypothetical protein PAEPH01_0623 [Pancytospora epiphaga]
MTIKHYRNYLKNVGMINFYDQLSSKNIRITESIESYIQTTVLKKTLESKSTWT